MVSAFYWSNINTQTDYLLTILQTDFSSFFFSSSFASLFIFLRFLVLQEAAYLIWKYANNEKWFSNDTETSNNEGFEIRYIEMPTRIEWAIPTRYLSVCLKFIYMYEKIEQSVNWFVSEVFFFFFDSIYQVARSYSIMVQPGKWSKNKKKLDE